MAVIEYQHGAWGVPTVVSYRELPFWPGAVGLHYAQSIFEGLKAFTHTDGELFVFRLSDHVQRFNTSARIMGMPLLDEHLHSDLLLRLLDADRASCPKQAGSFLYIRPFMIATEDAVSVKPSTSYRYIAFLSPSGPYYVEGLKGITLLLTKRFKRVAIGGIGKAKTAANYGSLMPALAFARSLEAQQVLFTDTTNTFIEEAGVMNHYHVTEQEIIIPAFTDSILESITARSILELGNIAGHAVIQKPILVEEFIRDLRSKKITEAGGIGTAAIVAPVTHYVLDDGEKISVGSGMVGPVTTALYETIRGIQEGIQPAPSGWLTKVPRSL